MRDMDRRREAFNEARCMVISESRPDCGRAFHHEPAVCAGAFRVR